MPEDNQNQEKSLEELTNETYGQEGVPQLNEASELLNKDVPEKESDSNDATPAKDQTTQSGGQADDLKLSDEEKALLTEIRAVTEMAGTPFKSPSDLVKGYKELQGQYTKDREFISKVKPHEQLLGDLNDPQLANFVQQAVMLYRNPQLASAYVNQSGSVNSPPDPRSYNMYDDGDLARYQKDLGDYNSRQVDSRINARLGGIESQNRIEKEKLSLKQVFPDANPDAVMDWVAKRGNNWTLADAHKIMDYDNLKAKATEGARKELTQKLETAAKTTTPKAEASPKGGVKIEDIVAHIGRYGGDSARKKFGAQAFTEAMKESAYGL